MSNEPVSLPVIETVKAAWGKVSGSKATLWAVLALLIVTRIILAGFDELNKNSVEFTAFVEVILDVIAIILSVFSLVLNWCLIYLGVRRALEMPIQFNMIKAIFNWKLFFRMIGMLILQLVVLIPAIIVMLIPLLFSSLEADANAIISAICYIISAVIAVYLLMRMWLSTAIILVSDAKPLNAIKHSFRATKGNVWRLIGLTVLNMIIIFVSAIPFGIGLIWTLPYALINYGEVYKKLVVDVKA